MAAGTGYPGRMPWRWALFDVGETLIRPRESFGAVYARVLEGLGHPGDAAALERSLRATWAEVNAALPLGADRYRVHPGGEEAYWLRFVRRTLQLAGGYAEGTAERALEPLRDAFSTPRAWEVHADAEPALDRLAAAGIGLGIVSNWDSRLPGLLEQLGLAHRFRTVTVSSLEGVEKPDPAIFTRALRRLGARPEETVHVGDVPELDGAGARAAGVVSLLVDRRGALGGGAFRDLGAVASSVLAGA
jgi:putative hydrolase of the HAD superfamily